jgi:hypothetical protein
MVFQSPNEIRDCSAIPKLEYGSAVENHLGSRSNERKWDNLDYTGRVFLEWAKALPESMPKLAV